MERCNECENCKKLERVKQRVLACSNPPFSHADDGVVELWNRELAELPCLGGICECCGAPMTDLSGEVPCCSNPYCEVHP